LPARAFLFGLCRVTLPANRLQVVHLVRAALELRRNVIHLGGGRISAIAEAGPAEPHVSTHDSAAELLPPRAVSALLSRASAFPIHCGRALGIAACRAILR